MSLKNKYQGLDNAAACLLERLEREEGFSDVNEMRKPHYITVVNLDVTSDAHYTVRHTSGRFGWNVKNK